MKTLVIYTSQTGFTKRYAEWITEKTGADIFDISEAKKKSDDFLKGYDAIVYAGWCMAGKVVKSDWFFRKAEALKDKKLAVVAVGGSPNDSSDVEVTLERLLTDEQRNYIKAFYCQGGIDYDKLKGPTKVVLKMFAKSLSKSKDEKTRETAEYISHSYDNSDIKYIEPIVDFIGEK